MATLSQRRAELAGLLATAFPGHRITTDRETAEAPAHLPMINLQIASTGTSGLVVWNLSFVQPDIGAPPADDLIDLLNAAFASEAVPRRVAGSVRLTHHSATASMLVKVEEAYSGDAEPVALYRHAGLVASLPGGIDAGTQSFGSPLPEVPLEQGDKLMACDSTGWEYVGEALTVGPVLTSSLATSRDLAAPSYVMRLYNSVRAPVAAIETERHDPGRYSIVSTTQLGARRSRMTANKTWVLSLEWPLLWRDQLEALTQQATAFPDRPALAVVRSDRSVVEAMCTRVEKQVHPDLQRGSLRLDMQINEPPNAALLAEV